MSGAKEAIADMQEMMELGEHARCLRAVLKRLRRCDLAPNSALVRAEAHLRLLDETNHCGDEVYFALEQHFYDALAALPDDHAMPLRDVADACVAFAHTQLLCLDPPMHGRLLLALLAGMREDAAAVHLARAACAPPRPHAAPERQFAQALVKRLADFV